APACKQPPSAQGGAPPVCLLTAVTTNALHYLLNSHLFDRLLEDDACVIQIFLIRGDVQNKSSESKRDVTGYLSSYFGIVSDQVRTEGFVVLERDQPVRIVFQGFAELGELLVPDGI